MVGATSGIVVGYLLARFTLAERLLSPYLVAAQATPILALAPLLVLWLGTGLAPKVVICGLICSSRWPSRPWSASAPSTTGCSSLAEASAQRAGRSFRYLELPGALPQILGGLRVGATLAVIGAIVAEWAGADRGLGYLINSCPRQPVRYPVVVRDARDHRAIGVLIYLASCCSSARRRLLEVKVFRRLFIALAFVVACRLPRAPRRVPVRRRRQPS